MKTNNLPLPIKNMLAYRRKKRVEYVLSKVKLSPNMRILDVGCGPDSRGFDTFVPREWHIVGVDLEPKEKVRHDHPNFTYYEQDAQDLSQFADKQFDLVVSFGMLEHVTDKQTFLNVISEIKRTARQYLVVVPYKYCWVEPHWGFPFFPVFPDFIQRLIVRIFNLGGHRETVKKDINYIKKGYAWHSNSEYLRYFGDGAKIYLLPTLETIAIVKSD